MIEIGDRLKGEIRFNRSGSAYVVSDKLPKDIYINKKNTFKSLHLDNVDIEIIEGNGRALEGVVTKVTKRNKVNFVGTVQKSDKFCFILPDNNKVHVDFYVPKELASNAENGQKVIVKLKRWDKRKKNPTGEIIEVLGNSGENETEISSILHEYGISSDFSEDILDEIRNVTNEITEDELSKRRDMRNDLTFTIDPETAKDFDDALSVKIIDDNLIQVGVHIADVTHFLRPGTQLDIEAYQRGTSIYMVDRTIPMLPEKLSNDLCSLNPNEDKYTFSAVFNLDRNGSIKEQWFGKTLIHSDKRFTYQQAQDIIEKEGDEIEDNFDIAIHSLNNIAKKLRQKRGNDGSINFNKKEVGFILDSEKKPMGIKIKTSLDSNKLIEEFMLLANKQVASFIKSKKSPCVNRGHESPSEMKLEAIRDFASKFGYNPDFSNPNKVRESLNKILKESENTNEANVLSTLIVRSMQKAFYTTKNIGHYGLNFEDYSHFTSPIRRYSDVLTHRILYRLLNDKTPMKIDKLESRCKYLSNMERKAKKAERDSIKFKQIEYMSDKIGRLYEGVVSGIIDSGLFVEITDNQCEGFVKNINISGDSYSTESSNYRVIGKNTKDTITLGDKVHVIVESVNLEFRELNLKIIRF